MKNKNKVSVNTYIRTLYSPEFASVMMYFYNEYFAFCFASYVGKRNDGRQQYDTENRLRTTLNYEGAAVLRLISLQIIDGKYSDIPVKLLLPCNGNTSLVLEYKPDGENSYAYLNIEKDRQTISFRFQTHVFKVKENGQVITKVIQSGLGVFAMTLEGYLSDINASGHLNKLPDNFAEAYLVNPNESTDSNPTVTSEKEETW